MTCSYKESFLTILYGFLCETSEASEEDIDTLFDALPLDRETTPLAPAPPMPAIGEPHPSFFAHATLQDLELLRANTNTAKSTGMWVKRFNKWRMERQIAQNLEEILKDRGSGAGPANPAATGPMF